MFHNHMFSHFLHIKEYQWVIYEGFGNIFFPFVGIFLIMTYTYIMENVKKLSFFVVVVVIVVDPKSQQDFRNL